MLKDREEVIQTANTMYPFLCCMDNEYGYWIPVKVLDSSFEKDETKWVLKKIDATNGWIFSGFLRKIEE